MLKRTVILATVMSLVTGLMDANVSWAGAEHWEYQGKAATGESVTVNLDSVQVAQRSLGLKQPPAYFFTYQIGRDRIQAFTACNGQYFTSTDRGDTYKNLVKPSSNATWKMLDRVCSYRVQRAQVFAPPSHVRMGPAGNVICTLRNTARITTYGQAGEWFYTDACGKLGMIHVSQIR
jgi:hypothetical protein